MDYESLSDRMFELYMKMYEFEHENYEDYFIITKNISGIYFDYKIIFIVENNLNKNNLKFDIICGKLNTEYINKNIVPIIIKHINGYFEDNHIFIKKSFLCKLVKELP